ncbi:threonine ammonia-lyase, biosynthetic [Pseudomonas sp. CDFA 610]|nr:threonine ammonia-lyase, biosynthetic [Pseudomonas sp. CDFA 610]
MLESYVKKIHGSRIYEVAVKTPLQEAPQLSSRLNNRVLLKREDLQPVYSFKLRGAYHKLTQLTDAQRGLGVITASAGNHAQGLALAAKILGCSATIVMPVTTPEIKIEGVRSRGANVVLQGDSFPEALAHALSLCEEHGFTFVHPYDDPDVIVGQGTVAMEILRQHPDSIDAIFVPVGGGGLIAGIAAYIKYMRPEILVIGVEPEDSNCLQQALQAGQRVILPQVGLFADGVAVSQIGAHTFDVCRTSVDDVITVSSDEICAAIKDIFEDTRSIPEPAGALGLAGMKKYISKRRLSGKTLIAINSGANINFDRLRHVAERADIGKEREAVFAVTLPERAGSLWSLCETLRDRQITEFGYRCQNGPEAQVFLGVQTRPEHAPRSELIQSLKACGLRVTDLTHNELAKSHVRHMMGGRATHPFNEVLFRFEFPERPGALVRFLEKIGTQWSISMFHYRNHGAAEAHVIVGMHVPVEDKPRLLDVLDTVGYPYRDETDNVAYTLFLGQTTVLTPLQQRMPVVTTRKYPAMKVGEHCGEVTLV